MSHILKSSFAAAALLAAAGPAFATVSASDPNTVVEALKANGATVEVTTDKTGDPKLIAAKSGVTTYIYFYGCTNNIKCTSFQFNSSFDTKGKYTFEKTNKFNTEYRYVKVVSDDVNDPHLKYDVYTGKSGISDEYFSDVYDLWLSSIEALKSEARQ